MFDISELLIRFQLSKISTFSNFVKFLKKNLLSLKSRLQMGHVFDHIGIFFHISYIDVFLCGFWLNFISCLIQSAQHIIFFGLI